MTHRAYKVVGTTTDYYEDGRSTRFGGPTPRNHDQSRFKSEGILTFGRLLEIAISQ
jgi:hypothetical protein